MHSQIRPDMTFMKTVNSATGIILKIILIIMVIYGLSFTSKLFYLFSYNTSGTSTANRTQFYGFECEETEVPFGGVNARFCDASPDPIAFINGSRKSFLPVLALQAIVLSVTTNTTAFKSILSYMGIYIQNRSASAIKSIHLGEDITLAPDSDFFHDQVEFIGKLIRIARVFP